MFMRSVLSLFLDLKTDSEVPSEPSDEDSAYYESNIEEYNDEFSGSGSVEKEDIEVAQTSSSKEDDDDDSMEVISGIIDVEIKIAQVSTT
ncbi:hypothetical protein V5799_008688 [Amblyomma americanum]|uniref:Secreted protein n=1 Tax=Amblyomma americanum TaxID=6943 RepID=A0AAQ4FCK6_AMBAM